MLIIKYIPTCEPYNKGRNKKIDFKTKETKKERLKEPLKMFYVTKVSFLNN